jgi:hypothetical protein
MLVAEGLDLGLVAGDQRRRHQFGEMRDQDLFGRIAHLGGVIDHQRLRVDALQQMRRGDIGHVEGRVLPQQHDVDATTSLPRSESLSGV